MNECGEVELVDEYVDMSGCERASIRHVTSAISVVALKPSFYRRDFCTNAACVYR